MKEVKLVTFIRQSETLKWTETEATSKKKKKEEPSGTIQKRKRHRKTTILLGFFLLSVIKTNYCFGHSVVFFLYQERKKDLFTLL